MTSSFELVGGDPAIDFVNTVDWTGAGLVNERLSGYDDLLGWALATGVVPSGVGQRLRRIAAARPQEAGAVHAAGLRTRAVLHAVFAGVVAGESRDVPFREFNDLLGETLDRLELVKGKPARWGWRGMDQRLDSVLWPVVRSAAHLLTSTEARQIRVCAGSDCGWMFVDRSRNGLRRWCQMRTCGTREKTRKRRA